jgi:hypothetical protein
MARHGRSSPWTSRQTCVRHRPILTHVHTHTPASQLSLTEVGWARERERKREISRRNKKTLLARESRIDVRERERETEISRPNEKIRQRERDLVTERKDASTPRTRLGLGQRLGRRLRRGHRGRRRRPVSVRGPSSHTRTHTHATHTRALTLARA